MSNSALILWRVKEMTGFTFACTGLHIVCVGKMGIHYTYHVKLKIVGCNVSLPSTSSSSQICLTNEAPLSKTASSSILKGTKKELKMLHKDHDMG